MYVHVRVVPGARRETVTKESDTEFYIAVKEPKERNLANTRVREILAHKFGVQIGQVRMITGHRSPSKMFSIGVD